MRRHSLQRWLIWLLPLVLLRAFVPAGFMISQGEDGWLLAWCGGVAEQTLPSAHHEGHAHHAEHGQQRESPSGGAHYSPCPYSLVASATTVSIDHVAPQGLAPSDEPMQRYAARDAGIASARAHRIRGPPRLS
jgi:hypothetical protein